MPRCWLHFSRLEKANSIFTDNDIREAVDLWCRDRAAAEYEYDHISQWNTSAVTDMSGLFTKGYFKRKGMEYFNDDISQWNVSNVTNMQYMFHDASAFNQPLEQWNVGNVTNMKDMFRGSGISSANKPRWR